MQIFLKTEQNNSVFVWKQISVDRALISIIIDIIFIFIKILVDDSGMCEDL